MNFHDYNQVEKDLEALWLALPHETLGKLNKLPPGFRDSYLTFMRSYAKSAYELGALGARQDCHEVMKVITDRLQPDKDLSSSFYTFSHSSPQAAA